MKPRAVVQRAVNRLGVSSPARDDAERAALDELVAWRRRAVPDETTPLDAEDLVTLLRDCTNALALDPEIASGVSVNTIHYYRRKDIIDPPVERQPPRDTLYITSGKSPAPDWPARSAS